MKLEKSGKLLDILFMLYKDSSKKKVKGYLKSGCVFVNGKQVTQYDAFVKAGSELEIRKENKTHKKSSLNILFEDDTFLVIDKPAGLLSIGTEKEKEKTAYHKMRTFIRERGRGEKIFCLHRLDKDTSGVLIFVKNDRIKKTLQNDWNKYVKERVYIALVDGVSKEKDIVTCFLEEGKDLKMHVVTKEKGKKCVTKYEKIAGNEKRSLLKVSLETGRKNQIRASLAFCHLPIIGDLKYGYNKKENRLYLHASKVVLEHPLTKKQYTFESKIPGIFKKSL